MPAESSARENYVCTQVVALSRLVALGITVQCDFVLSTRHRHPRRRSCDSPIAQNVSGSAYIGRPRDLRIDHKIARVSGRFSAGICENHLHARGPCGRGFCVPRTDVITNSEELGNWIAHVGLPVVLKANGTSGGYRSQGCPHERRGGTWAKSPLAPPTFPRAVKRALVDHDFTLVWPSVVRQRYVVNAQAFVLGCEATTAVACWQGRVLAAIHFQVLRKRDSAGPATVVRTIENEEMSSAVCKMVSKAAAFGGFMDSISWWKPTPVVHI